MADKDQVYRIVIYVNGLCFVSTEEYDNAYDGYHTMEWDLVDEESIDSSKLIVDRHRDIDTNNEYSQEEA